MVLHSTNLRHVGWQWSQRLRAGIRDKEIIPFRFPFPARFSIGAEGGLRMRLIWRRVQQYREVGGAELLITLCT